MPEPESDRLLSAFRSLSDGRDRVRPGLEQLEQRITRDGAEFAGPSPAVVRPS